MERSESAVSLEPEQVRESITRFLENVESGDPQELADKLFQENGEFSELLIRSIPGAISTVTQILKSFVESLEGMPADKSTELLASSLSQVDGKKIGEAVNAVTRLLIQLHEQDPELYPENRMGITSGVVEAVDFGDLRKALTYQSQSRFKYLRKEVELVGNHPVALINLFDVLPPYINEVLKLVAELLNALALPPEAITYALFTILEEVEWEEFSKALNSAARLANILHRGNLILGDGSLESRKVLARISKDILTSLDGEEIAEAIAAIGEEGEVLITSFASTALEDESLVLSLSEALISVANSSLRFASTILEKINDLPPKTLGKIADGLAEDFEAKELGRALNPLVALGGRLRAEKPELFSTIFKTTLAAANLDEILSPGAIGARVNKTLASYNRLSQENPRLLEESLDDFLNNVDARQLSQATRTTAGQVAEVASRHPDLIKASLKVFLSMIYKTLKVYIRNLWSNGRKRQGG